MLSFIGTSTIALTIAVGPVAALARVDQVVSDVRVVTGSSAALIVDNQNIFSGDRSARDTVVDASETVNPDIAWVKAVERIRYLSNLGDDFDGEGASAPNPASVQSAISFVTNLPFFAPKPMPGLDSEGCVVVEFHEGDEIGQVTIRDNETVEVFYSRPAFDPVYFEGPFADRDVQLKFLSVFGFPFVA